MKVEFNHDEMRYVNTETFRKIICDLKKIELHLANCIPHKNL